METNVLSFDEFWGQYPRKVAKTAARRVWDRLILKGRIPHNIMETLVLHKAQLWKAKESEYIPHPRTWLNQERWDDDLPVRVGINDKARQVELDNYRKQQEMMGG